MFPVVTSSTEQIASYRHSAQARPLESSVTLVNSQLMWFASGHLKILLVVFIESKLFVPVLIFLICRPRCKLLSYQSFCDPLQVNFYPFIYSKIGPVLTLLLMVHFNVQSCE